MKSQPCPGQVCHWASSVFGSGEPQWSAWTSLCVLGQVINFSGPRFVSSHEEDKDACSVEQSEDEMLSYLALTQHSVLHVGSVSH